MKAHYVFVFILASLTACDGSSVQVETESKTFKPLAHESSQREDKDQLDGPVAELRGQAAAGSCQQRTCGNGSIGYIGPPSCQPRC